MNPLSSAEFNKMHDDFVAISSKIHGKWETKKFLKSVQRCFGYSDVLEFRKNLCVLLFRDGVEEFYAYSVSSDRFYALDWNAIRP